jgi:LemA protein
MENYPDLKANQNVLQLQEELTTTENQIAFSRQYYNDLVMRFNMKQEVFPSSMVASFFRFQPGEFFNIAETEKIAPRVNLTLPA